MTGTFGTFVVTHAISQWERTRFHAEYDLELMNSSYSALKVLRKLTFCGILQKE